MQNSSDSNFFGGLIFFLYLKFVRKEIEDLTKVLKFEEKKGTRLIALWKKTWVWGKEQQNSKWNVASGAGLL